VLRPADTKSVRAKLRTEDGFGLIELLISIVMLNVGVLALVAAFNSGSLAIQRASQTATAATLAEKQMELYRAQQYVNVALDAALTTTASGNSTYAGDTAYSATQVTKICAGSPSSVAYQCNPMRTVTGPDDVSYRVDTYIVSFTPTNGRAVQRVTVVVRRSTSLRTLARLTSTFDQSTG
jgi:Tfp pilus assembly protein PilV